MAEQYQNLRLYEQSEILLQQVLAQKEIYKNSDNHVITLAKVKQLHAINLSVLNDKEQAQKIFGRSNNDLRLDSKENFIIQSENKILEASILISIENYEVAKIQLNNVLSDLINFPEDKFLMALAKERLARIYFADNDYSKAIQILTEGFQSIENLDYLPLKSKYYEVFAKNYLAIGDETNYKNYQKLFTDSKLKLDQNQKEGIRFLTKLTETHQNQTQQFVEDQERNFTKWLIVVSGLIVLFLVVYYIVAKKRSKDYQKQLEFFEKQNLSLKSNQKVVVNAQNNQDEIESAKAKFSPKKQLSIPKETEIDLLEKLNDFEKSTRFLSKDMSLAVLAGQLDTNTKYLSEIINHYKEKNFNAYVNELRVNYIALKLKTDSTYLQYKVSYLAEEAGFSSHSSFTTVFKAITGMSPNHYIQQINQSKS